MIVLVYCSSVFTVDLEQVFSYIITVRYKLEVNPNRVGIGIVSLLLALSKYLPTEI